MKVLLVTYNYPPNTGGMETHVYELARVLSTTHDVRVLWFNHDYSDTVESPKGVETIRCPLVAENSFRESMLVTALRQAWRLNQVVQTFDPDIIHGHSMGLCYGLGLARLMGNDCPVVITNHSSRFLRRHHSDTVLNSMKQRFEGLIPDAVITPSTELKETTKTITDAPVTMIPNGVDPSEFSPQAKKPSEVPNIALTSKFVVLAVRRFVPKNGMKFLVQSIPKTDDDVAFLFIGDGEQREDLMKWVAEQDLEQRADFLGQIPHEYIPGYYRIADISVLPSLKEAISLSGIESMACGTPVIGTNVGGIPELITDEEDGLLIEPRNPDEIANTSLKNNPELLEIMAKNARKKAVKEFSWRAVAEKTLTVYNRTLV